MSGRYPTPSGWPPSSMNDPGCKSIRISNLALTVSEDDLHRIFSQLGTLTDLWVAVDAQNNPIGSAFCEFQDPDKVQIAVAHLNNVSFKGNHITIEPTSNTLWKEDRNKIRQSAERSRSNNMTNTSTSSSQDSAENLANLNSEQMFNLMHQMKLCIEADPIRAREALLRNFTLSAGMLQALLMMKLVDPAEALEVLMRDENPKIFTPAHVPPPNISIVPTRPELQSQLPVYSLPPAAQQPYPVGSSIMMDPRQARAMRTGYGPPPRPYLSNSHVPSQQISSSTSSQIETERAAMLMQLIQMSDQQLAALAPEQRQAVLMLREQLAMQM